MSPEPFEQIIELNPNVTLNATMCSMTRLSRLEVVTLQGHVINPSIYVHSLSPEPFSLKFIQIFLSVAICRTNDSAMQTQGQGYSSRV